MKRVAIIGSGLVLLLAVAGASAQETSLGEAARNARAERSKSTQHAKRVITNEDIPSSTVAAATAPAPEMAANADEAKGEGAKSEKPNAETPSGAFAQQAAEYRDKLTQKKQDITKLQDQIRELDRAIRAQATTYYINPGTKLRDPGEWVTQRQKMTDDLEAAKKKLADANEELQDISDRARKAGVSVSAVE